MKNYLLKLLIIFFLLPVILSVFHEKSYAQHIANWWLTNRDKSALLSEQQPLVFKRQPASENLPTIIVNPDKEYQT
ncbi:MAG: hypothetical protein ACRDE2_04790, partial [Chitinophagaceae bacterium]